MKYILVFEDGLWKIVCVKELNGFKKFKWKGKELVWCVNGYKIF